MAQFSTNEAVSLERNVDNGKLPTRTKLKDIDDVYETQKCVEWIKTSGLKKVCLQFPDYLLPDSCYVSARLQNLLGETVYIMGDSAYESCCVDYVTAQHVESDGIIHFGPKCFSKWTGVVPCLCIFEKADIDVAHLEEAFVRKFEGVQESITVVLDTPFVHKSSEIRRVLAKHHPSTEVVDADALGVSLGDKLVTYVGSNSRKLMNFRLIFKPKQLYFYDPEEAQPLIKNYEESNVIFKRRRFLREKIKDSRTFGIIIGTLVIENFIAVIDRIKRLLKLSGKTYYVVSVGRPTVAKLANFPEMDVYVLICCSMSDIYDSREFYKPIVTPYDVESALNPGVDDLNFSYDFSLCGEVAGNIDEDEIKRELRRPDVSLISGSVRSVEADEDEEDGTGESQVALRKEGTVALSERSGAGFLAGRTFRGLERKLGEGEVKLAKEGRKGFAQHYENESF